MALVCVTGGNGFFGSWLIKLLLERGYRVRATVRDPGMIFIPQIRGVGNLEKAAHLWNLPHANKQLELVKADLMDDGSFDSAVEGCEGVFHVASPVRFIVDNPEEDLINPAIKGTLNVLNACAKSTGLKRVVLTSSMGAVSIQALATSGSILVDESCWSEKEFCTKINAWYALSKLLAEQNAWTFAKKKGLDLVVLNPGLIAGRPLQNSLDTIDAGTGIVLSILTEQDSYWKTKALPWVDVRDVAEAHLLAFELPMASGRYICVERVMDGPTLQQVLEKICRALPVKYTDTPLPQAPIYRVSTEKSQKLGLTWRPIEGALKEIMDYLLEKGLWPQAFETAS